jgi:hypothetical protein
MASLPDDALALVRSIEARLAQADALGTHAQGGDDAFVVAETRRRYLPDTLAAFTALPAAVHDRPGPDGRTPHDQLVEQLRLLDAGVAARIDALARVKHDALGANGAFLRERLGESEPAAPLAAPGPAAPAVLVRNLFALGSDRLDARAALDAIGSRLAAAFPQIVQVARGGLFGRGPIERIVLDVPVAGNSMRYDLALGRRGELAASVAKVVRGVTLRTEACTFDEWTEALYEDLGAYAARDARARETLARVFS